MSDLVERLDKWLAANRPEYYRGLAPGASEKEIAAVEAKLGVTLPDDLRDLLKWRNGQKSTRSGGIYHTFSLMSAQEIEETRRAYWK